MPILHQNATPAARDFVRAYVWLLWIGSLLLLSLTDIGHLPISSHLNTGLTRWLPETLLGLLLTPTALAILKFATIAAIASQLFYRKRVGIGVFACVLLTLIQCLLRGFGHVNHAELILLFSAYTVTYFDYIDSNSSQLDERQLGKAQLPSNGGPLVAIVFVMCFSYALTGVCRLGNGGIAVFTSRSLTACIEMAAASPRYFDLSFGSKLMNWPAYVTMVEAGFPVVTLIEILAPLCLVSVWFRRGFLLLMVPFHLMVFLMMGILFWENLAMYVLLFDISKWLENTAPVGRRSFSLNLANSQT